MVAGKSKVLGGNSSPENVPFLQRGATTTRLSSYTLHTAPEKAALKEGSGTHWLFLWGRKAANQLLFLLCCLGIVSLPGQSDSSALRNRMKRRKPSFCIKEKDWRGIFVWLGPATTWHKAMPCTWVFRAHSSGITEMHTARIKIIRLGPYLWPVSLTGDGAQGAGL